MVDGCTQCSSARRTGEQEHEGANSNACPCPFVTHKCSCRTVRILAPRDALTASKCIGHRLRGKGELCWLDIAPALMMRTVTRLPLSSRRTCLVRVSSPCSLLRRDPERMGNEVALANPGPGDTPLGFGRLHGTRPNYSYV